ncbi:MAG: hypothetical protein LBN29_07740 [Mediterranea sp.]|jgi:hypothetical protein|nr:hypothetical protein [Mediterranea sp.]
MKAKEPTAVYASLPFVNRQRKKVAELLKKEKDIDKINQCLEILSPKYDDAYWEKTYGEQLDQQKGKPMPCQFTDEELENELRASDRSGIADSEEINSFFEWMRSR